MDKNDVGETIHALAHFLEKRLPELGLDFETYGAYILPLLTEEQVDEDEWTSVMELLQASSEIEEDTNSQQIWIDFRREIEQAWKDHCQQQAILEAQQHEERQRQIEEQIARDREFAAAAAAASTLSTNDNHNDTTIRQHPPTDETEDSSELKKRALIERFGYDVPDDEEEGGGERTADDSSAPLTNRQVAKLAEMERAQQLRAHKGTTTKKEEQQKTAEAKRNKQQLKEERRKRATKGERKR